MAVLHHISCLRARQTEVHELPQIRSNPTGWADTCTHYYRQSQHSNSIFDNYKNLAHDTINDHFTISPPISSPVITYLFCDAFIWSKWCWFIQLRFPPPYCEPSFPHILYLSTFRAWVRGMGNTKRGRGHFPGCQAPRFRPANCRATCPVSAMDYTTITCGRKDSRGDLALTNSLFLLLNSSRNFTMLPAG